MIRQPLSEQLLHSSLDTEVVLLAILMMVAVDVRSLQALEALEE